MTDLLSLAAVGEVGSDFFKPRDASTLCQANNSNLFCWDWAKNNIDRYEPFFLEHVELVVISVLIGFFVAFGLALLSRRWSWLRLPFLLGTGALYTIPSVAFFFLLLPLTGRGRDTAIIALSVYTLQIIYRNTVLGLDNVPGASIDAARGMGMTDRQVLRKVELPLALPEIVTGLIVATVSTVAIATLAALAGGGGLGEVIVGREKLGIDFKTNLIIAGGLTVGLAIVFGLLLTGAQRLMTPWRRARPA
jgi:osmoprotectant transport system permease protein